MSEGKPRARALTRRRRENVAGGRMHRHEVTVTPEEEGLLLRLSLEQGVTIPRLLIEAATTEHAAETATDRRALLTELFGLHRGVAAVGNNLNQLTRGANATGEYSAELRHTLAAVRRQMIRIDEAIDGLTQA